MLHANYVIGLLVLEKIVKRFTIYGHVGHLGDQDHFYKLMSPLPEAPHKLALIGQAGSWRCLELMIYEIDIAPGLGQKTPGDKNTNLLSVWSFTASFLLYMTL